MQCWLESTLGTPSAPDGLGGCLFAIRESRVNRRDFSLREMQSFWHYVGRHSSECPVKAVFCDACPVNLCISWQVPYHQGSCHRHFPAWAPTGSWWWSRQCSALGTEETAALTLPTEVIQSLFPSYTFPQSAVTQSLSCHWLWQCWELPIPWTCWL